MPLHPHFNRRNRRRAGMTLVEVLFASAIGVTIIAGLMVLMLDVVREQRKTLADASLEQAAGNLQDQLSRAVRGMSATESVIFGDRAVENGAGVYRKIIVAKGQAPDYPREEIAFRTTDNSVVYDPNRAVVGDEICFFKTNAVVAIRKLFFYPSLKSGGVPDSSTLNIWLEMDDCGASGRRMGDAFKTNTIVRTFTVKMRNT
jgi:type II secretory pathway pseudopilin PulG